MNLLLLSVCLHVATTAPACRDELSVQNRLESADPVCDSPHSGAGMTMRDVRA